MRGTLWRAGLGLLCVALFLLMWQQAFRLTGVTDAVVPAGVERPAPPPAAKLSPLPLAQASIELYARAHPVWSGLDL